MAEFSYASDIAPLRAQFFPIGGISGVERRQLAAQYEKQIAPIEKNRRATQLQMLQAQDQELQFEARKLQLQEAKREAKMKADTENRLPTLMTELDGVLNNPALDTNTKATEVGKINMKYAGISTYNPAVNTLLQSANNQINTLSNIDQNKDRLAQIEEQKRTALLGVAVQTGDAEIAKAIAEQDGVSELEKGYIGLAEKEAARNKAKIEQEQTKQQLEAAEQSRKEQLDRFKLYESRLKDLGALGDTIDVGTIGGTSKTKTQAKPEFKVTPQNRIQLEALMLQLNPTLSLSEVQNTKDKDLYTATVLKVQQGLTELSPSPKAPSVIIDSFSK